RSGKDYRIGEIKSPPKASMMGQIYDAKMEANGRTTFGVYFRKPRARFFAGYEQVKVDLDREGECRAEQFTADAEENGQSSRVFFKTKAHEKSEEVSLLFYRTGTSDVVVSCGDKVVYEKRFKPEI
ncbi:MAG: hypothetical protein HY042_11055, partial [Spirochaetia bacterium]|nr:hypothetical protein [Spirochaetia bacterium]